LSGLRIQSKTVTLNSDCACHPSDHQKQLIKGVAGSQRGRLVHSMVSGRGYLQRCTLHKTIGRSDDASQFGAAERLWLITLLNGLLIQLLNISFEIGISVPAWLLCPR
jgi:hypothetical protein